jgi:hypothetical protein
MKMIFGISSALVGAALFSGTPATAQSRADADRVMQDYARCVVNGNPAEARGLIALSPETKEAESAVKAMASGRDGCLRTNGGSQLRMQTPALRAAIARQLYLRDVPASPADRVADTSIPFTGSGNAQLVSYDVARCAATRDPVAADMLIRADVRSDAEKTALQRLMPIISGCTPAGARLGFNRDTLRGHLAEALLAARATGA